MSNIRPLRPLRPLLFLALALLTGCSTPELYYRLSPDGPAPASGSGIVLGVGPITLPDYIDRGEIVFQSTDTRFEIPYGQRWAGSLRDTATRALGTNLARRLNTGNLHTYPWTLRTPLDYQVKVEIRQFHARSQGDAILDASWTVENGRTGVVVVRNSANFSEPVRKDGYEGLVDAENRLLVQFSDAIVASFPRQ